MIFTIAFSCTCARSNHSSNGRLTSSLYLRSPTRSYTVPRQKFVPATVHDPTKTRRVLTLTPSILTMLRSFSTLISKNIKRSYKLTAKKRLKIITKYKARVLHKNLAEKFQCTKRCITNTIKKQKYYNTISSLPKIGCLKVIIYYKKHFI